MSWTTGNSYPAEPIYMNIVPQKKKLASRFKQSKYLIIFATVFHWYSNMHVVCEFSKTKVISYSGNTDWCSEPHESLKN